MIGSKILKVYPQKKRPLGLMWRTCRDPRGPVHMRNTARINQLRQERLDAKTITFPRVRDLPYGGRSGIFQPKSEIMPIMLSDKARDFAQLYGAGPRLTEFLGPQEPDRRDHSEQYNTIYRDTLFGSLVNDAADDAMRGFKQIPYMQMGAEMMSLPGVGPHDDDEVDDSDEIPWDDEDEDEDNFIDFDDEEDFDDHPLDSDYMDN